MDQYLNSSELRELARRNGSKMYTDVAWAKEYAALARDYQFSVPDGMPLIKATQMLNDDTGMGAYMTDEQALHAVLQLKKDRQTERDILMVVTQHVPGRAIVVIEDSVARVAWSCLQGPSHRANRFATTK